MSAPAFTPGPWATNCSHIYAPDGAIIAVVHNPGSKASEYPLVANRDIMAAAPELYELLEDVAEHYRMLARFTEVRNIYEVEKATGKRVRKGWREVIGTECEAAQAKVTAALAKARGETA